MTLNLHFAIFGSWHRQLLILPEINVKVSINEYYHFETKKIYILWHLLWLPQNWTVPLTNIFPCHLRFSHFLLSFFLRLSVYMVYMLVCVPAHVWGDSCGSRWAGGWGWERLSTALHSSHWGRVSQWSSEPANMSSLASQFAPGSPPSALAVLKLQAGHHTHLAFIWVLDTRAPVLMLVWQVSYQLSRFPSPPLLSLDLPLLWWAVSFLTYSPFPTDLALNTPDTSINNILYFLPFL